MNENLPTKSASTMAKEAKLIILEDAERKSTEIKEQDEFFEQNNSFDV